MPDKIQFPKHYKELNTVDIPTPVSIMEKTRPSARSLQFLRDYKKTLSNPINFHFFRPADVFYGRPYRYHWNEANAKILTQSQMNGIVQGKLPTAAIRREPEDHYFARSPSVMRLPVISTKNLVEQETNVTDTKTESEEKHKENELLSSVPKEKKKGRRKRHKDHCHHRRKHEKEQVEETPKVLLVPEATIEMIETKASVVDIVPEFSIEIEGLSTLDVNASTDDTSHVREESFESTDEVAKSLSLLPQSTKPTKTRPSSTPIDTSAKRKSYAKGGRRPTFLNSSTSFDGNAVAAALRVRTDKCVVLWNFALFAVCQQHRLKSIPEMAKVQPFVNLSHHVSDNSWFLSSGKLLRCVAQGFDLHDMLITFQQSEKFVDGDATSLRIDDLLRSVESIDKLKPAVRAHIAATARLEIHERGKKVVMEKGDVTTVYYLLCGLCVEHQTSPTGQQELIKFIATGDCVGDFVGNAMVKRKSSVTILMRSLFLCVEKADWIMAMKRGNSEAIMIESISSLPMFYNLSSTALQQLSDVCMDTKVVAGELLCAPHEEPTVLNFIIKGKCSYVLNIPFVKTVKDDSLGLIAPSEYQVIPYYGQKLNPEKDEIVFVPHYMGELGPGDAFPPLHKDVRGTYKCYMIQSVAATDCISFTLDTVTEKFPDIAMQQIRQHQETLFLSDFQVRELQEHYLSTKGWRNDNESQLSRVLADEVDKERQQRIMERFIANSSK